MNLSDRIKELRGKAGLTQDELAKKVGVSRPTIISWEKGATSPDAKEVATLSKILDNDLTNLTNENLKNKPVPEEVRLLIKAIEQIGNTNDYLLHRVKELEDQLRGRK
jgi:transcriptional regulator with XRE-family HTH domain